MISVIISVSCLVLFFPVFVKLAENPNQYVFHLCDLSVSLPAQLLQYNPLERLGAGAGGVDDIRSHPFFASVNWAKWWRRRGRARRAGHPVWHRPEHYTMKSSVQFGVDDTFILYFLHKSFILTWFCFFLLFFLYEISQEAVFYPLCKSLYQWDACEENRTIIVRCNNNNNNNNTEKKNWWWSETGSGIGRLPLETHSVWSRWVLFFFRPTRLWLPCGSRRRKQEDTMQAEPATFSRLPVEWLDGSTRVENSVPCSTLTRSEEERRRPAQLQYLMAVFLESSLRSLSHVVHEGAAGLLHVPVSPTL